MSRQVNTLSALAATGPASRTSSLVAEEVTTLSTCTLIFALVAAEEETADSLELDDLRREPVGVFAALAARGMKMTCRLPLCRPRHARQLCRWRRELFCVRRVIPWMVVYVWGCIGARMFCCGMGTEAAKENNRVYRDVPVSELPCQGSLQAELVVCMQGVCTRMRAAAASVILHGGVA